MHRYSPNLECHSDSDGCDNWVTTFNLKSFGEIEADANGDCLAGSFEKQLNKTCLHFPTKYRISLNRNKIASKRQEFLKFLYYHEIQFYNGSFSGWNVNDNDDDDTANMNSWRDGY